MWINYKIITIKQFMDLYSAHSKINYYSASVILIKKMYNG